MNMYIWVPHLFEYHTYLSTTLIWVPHLFEYHTYLSTTLIWGPLFYIQAARRHLHRPLLVYRLKHLLVIDGIPVTDEERAKAELYFMDQQVMYWKFIRGFHRCIHCIDLLQNLLYAGFSPISVQYKQNFFTM